MISRNLAKRQQENARFLQLIRRFGAKSPKTAQVRPDKNQKDRTKFHYFKCPNCKQQLRAPKGKGRIKITCSKCGQVFYKKV